MPIWWVASSVPEYNWYALITAAGMLWLLYGPTCAACIQQYNNPGNF